jgi:hypothetical protein
VSEPAKSAPTPAPTATPRWASTVVIPTTWTPEQALAVFELLDDLRDRLWALHGSHIQHLLSQEQGSAASNALRADPGDDTASF